MAEQIKVPGVLRPGTSDYHSYAKDIIDDQLRNKKQSELNALFNQGKGIDKNGNIVPVAEGKAIDADDISYTEKVSPDSHKTGSMGKKVKELEDRINDLVPGEEYVSDTVIDLIDYILDGNTPQSFTYDSDTKYVYGGKVTTMCTYARNNTSYAAFKVVDIDKYIVYTIYDNTFTYYNELNSETLPNEARSKFELGKYALVKQLEGKTGDSWVDGKVGVFVDSSNRPMSFRYISSVEIYGQTLNNVLLGKTADGTNIYVYNLSSGLFKFNNRISPNDSAFEALNNLIVGASGGGGTNDYNDLINKPIFQKEGEEGYVLNTATSAIKGFSEGYLTSSYKQGSHAEGYSTKALKLASHAEGKNTMALGDFSHAEGCGGLALGESSHAEGDSLFYSIAVTRKYTQGDEYLYVYSNINCYSAIKQSNSDEVVYVTEIVKDTENDDYRLTLSAPLDRDINQQQIISHYGIAYGDYSHIEGEATIAFGSRAHAEGYRTTAANNQSHAEGASTYAGGMQSHAEGLNTITTNNAEHAEGMYNVSTPNKTLSSIGVGTQWRRKNAFEVDMDGNIYLCNIGGYDGTNITDANVKSVQQVITSLLSALT